VLLSVVMQETPNSSGWEHATVMRNQLLCVCEVERDICTPRLFSVCCKSVLHVALTSAVGHRCGVDSSV